MFEWHSVSMTLANFTILLATAGMVVYDVRRLAARHRERFKPFE